MGIPTTTNETTKVILTLQCAQGLCSVGTGRLRRRRGRELSRSGSTVGSETRARPRSGRGHRVEHRHEARVVGLVRDVGP